MCCSPWGRKGSDKSEGLNRTEENNHTHAQDSSVGKESACNAGDTGLIPGSGRSPGEGKGCPLQYSVLENSMNCTVRGVAKSHRIEQLN